MGLCFSLAQAQSLPARLDVVVVQGEGGINKIRRRAESDPIVRVEDGNHAPIVGAVVVFTLPTEGATGDFSGEKTVVLTTDAQGQAAPKALKLNGLPGKVPIHVSVSYRGLTARTVINQVSVVPPGEKASAGGKRGHGALIAVLVCLGGAAGGGAAYLLSQQKQQVAATPTPSSPTPIGITVGTGTIAGGR